MYSLISRRPRVYVYTKGRGGNPCLFASFIVGLFCFWVFWEEVVLKEEALRNPSSHFTDEETETPRGTSTGPKSHSECGGSCCISRAKPGLYVPKFLPPRGSGLGMATSKLCLRSGRWKWSAATFALTSV